MCHNIFILCFSPYYLKILRLFQAYGQYKHRWQRPGLAPGLSFPDPVPSHAPERKITFVIFILSLPLSFLNFWNLLKKQQKPTSVFQGPLAFLLKLAVLEPFSLGLLLFIPIESAVPLPALESFLISADSTFHLIMSPHLSDPVKTPFQRVAVDFLLVVHPSYIIFC